MAKTQARSARLPVARGFATVEGREKMRQIVKADAWSGVYDLDDDLAILHTPTHPDRATLGRVPQGIVEQILHHPRQEVTIPFHGARRLRAIQRERQTLLLATGQLMTTACRRGRRSAAHLPTHRDPAGGHDNPAVRKINWMLPPSRHVRARGSTSPGPSTYPATRTTILWAIVPQ